MNLPAIYLYSIGVVLLLCICNVIRRVLNYKYFLGQKSVILEITPPSHKQKTPLATQEFFSVLYEILSNNNFRDWLMGRVQNVSLELTSSREHGIRYLIEANERIVPAIEHHITAYLPGAHYSRVSDYLGSYKGRRFLIKKYKQVRHFAFPLAETENLTQHDPLSYMASAMRGLKASELVVFQLVISPAHPKGVERIQNDILQGVYSNFSRRTASYSTRSFLFVAHISWITVRLLLKTLVAVLFPWALLVAKASRSQYSRNKAILSHDYQQLLGTIYSKVSQRLFQTSVRILIVADEEKDIRQRYMSLDAVIGSFNVPGTQGLIPKGSIISKFARYRLFAFEHRLPDLFVKKACIFSASEIAALYHLPYGTGKYIDDLQVSHSRTLAAPLSLKQAQGFDVVLGRNYHHGSETDIGLTASERERHVYVIGGTGNGKTTMLQYAIVQDIQQGKGLAVIDPHGDLAETILEHVPPERVQDVVYLNPDDLGHPVGLNLLELPAGLSGDDLIREKDLVAEAVVSVFRKIFSDDGTGGHRIEYILRNAVHTALTIENATLFTVLKLLQNSAYRREHTRDLADNDLRDFWREEFGKAGSMQRVKMSAGVTAKLGRFRQSAAASRMLGQVQSTIDFEDIINSGKILICNFSKGLLGEDVSELFGITVLAKLQLAALRRARMPSDQRQTFYLYVDEFQNFATSSFVQMLSEARKYKLFLTMAEQSTSQQKDQQMVQVILANVGTVVCFRTGNPVDEQLFLPLFSPYLEKGEIAHLPAFSFYAKLSAVLAQEPVSGKTLLLEERGNHSVAQAAIRHSRAQYTASSSTPSLDTTTDNRDTGTSAVLDEAHLGIDRSSLTS